MKKTALFLTVTLMLGICAYAEPEAYYPATEVSTLPEALEEQPATGEIPSNPEEIQYQAQEGSETVYAEEIPSQPPEDPETVYTEETPEPQSPEEIPEPQPPEEVSPIKYIYTYAFGKGVTLSSCPMIKNGIPMIPIKEYLDYMGVHDFSIDETNQITITYGKKLVVMYLDSYEASINYQRVLLYEAPIMIDGTVYAVPHQIVEGLGFVCTTGFIGTEILTVNSDIPYHPESYVNSANLSSETPYLIWVNKSEFTVHVFLGSKNNWEEVYSCPCAIGAADSPTITGTFKFTSLESKWYYDDFYVGPIMRFYNSYAIHSTLLKYDGTDYDNRVNAKISHGCVRVRPENLEWLTFYVPLKTTVHVTDY